MPAAPRRLSYGPDPSQFGELHLPDGPGPWPVAVVLHGGFWRARYDLRLGTPVAAALAADGIAAWNVEYRRVGNGGGWPETALDVAAAVDRLSVIGPVFCGGALDLARIVALGHSAGGQLACWLAARPRLGAPFGPPGVAVTGVVSQAGVVDLRAAAADRLGDGAVDAYLAGFDGTDRARADSAWATASPIDRLPLGVPIRCVHGDADDSVPIDQSRRLVRAARAVGDDAELAVVAGGDHFGVITPGDSGWAASLAAVRELLAIA